VSIIIIIIIIITITTITIISIIIIFFIIIIIKATVKAACQANVSACHFGQACYQFVSPALVAKVSELL
jgi:hypothetical protein